jgi:hypothetical protein
MQKQTNGDGFTEVRQMAMEAASSFSLSRFLLLI